MQSSSLPDGARLISGIQIRRVHRSPGNIRSAIAFAEAQEPRRPVVTYKPRVRDAAPPPPDVPVMHSSTYLVGNQRAFSPSSEKDAVENHEDNTSKSFVGNAWEWALHKADEQLNRLESSPDGASKRALDVIKGPAGQVTLKTMQGVAAFTAAAGPQVLKAAGPVGKKLLQVSAQAVVAGVGALDSAQKKSKQRSDKSKSKGRR